MKKITVVIAVMVLSVLSCTVQVGTPVPTTPSPTPTEHPLFLVSTPIPEEKEPTIVQAVVKVRSYPSSNDGNRNVVGYLMTGSAVVVKECNAEWCRIAEPFGWVWRGCLSDNPDHLGCFGVEE